MKIKLVIVLYNIETPPESSRQNPNRILGGTFGTVVFTKDSEWNLPIEVKSGLQLGIVPGVGPLVVSEVRNDWTLEEPKITVELEYKVFEDDIAAFQNAVGIFNTNGFTRGKLFVDTKSAALIFPKKELERMQVWST